MTRFLAFAEILKVLYVFRETPFFTVDIFEFVMFEFRFAIYAIASNKSGIKKIAVINH